MCLIFIYFAIVYWTYRFSIVAPIIIQNQMGQKACFSAQNQKTFSHSKREVASKPSTTKLQILVDSWFPNSIDFSNNKNRISSIFFLRKDELSKQNPSCSLILNPQGSHQLRKKHTDNGIVKNTLKITPDQNNNFSVSSLDPEMHIWRFAKQWCHFDKDDPLFINGVQFRLAKLINDQSQLQKEATKLKKKYSIKEEQGKISPCKICFENTFDGKNLLMSPCKCGGSMANVHTRCLASWILENNLTQKDIFSANLKKQKCQICHSNYIQSKAFQQILQNVIFEAQGLQAPYALFEGVSIKQNKSYKSVLVISFKNKNLFKIGQTEQINKKKPLQGQQQSLNCQIKYEKGQIYIKQNGSKLGTGVLAQLPLQINNMQQESCFMVNHNMVISFSVLKKGNTTINSLNSSAISEDTSVNLTGK